MTVILGNKDWIKWDICYVWCVIYYLYKQIDNVEYNFYASMNKQ
jgi:hypothetical protein